MIRRIFILCALFAFNASAFAQSPLKEYDLRDTPTAKQLVNVIDRVMPGNKSSVTLNSFVFDAKSMQIRANMTIRASHSWGTLSIPNGFSFSGISYRDVEMAATATGNITFGYLLVRNQMRWRAKFRNFEVSDSGGSVEIPLGRISYSGFGYSRSHDLGTLRLSLDEIEQIIDGDWDVLLRKIPNFGVITREHDIEYKHIRQSYEKRYGKENVYFASPEFVRWASSERLGKWAVVGVLTGGANLEKVMKQVEKKSMEEFDKIKAWLQKRGLRAAAETALALLKGNRVDFPYMALKWQSVNYRSRVLVQKRPISPWVSVRHGAFAIIWTKGTGNVVKNDAIGNKPSAPKTVSTYRLGIGRRATGSLSRSDAKGSSSGRYYDVYLVNLKAGKSYIFDLKGNFDTYMNLIGESGKVAHNDDHNGDTRRSQIVYRAAKSGTHRIIVTSYEKATTGSYQLTAVAKSSGSNSGGSTKKRAIPSISVGGSRSGSLTTNDPLSGKKKRFDVYVAQLSAGRTYTFDLKGDYDTYMHLYSDGKRLASNDDHNGDTRRSRITYRVGDTDKYYVIVTSFAENKTGNYSLSLASGSGSSTPKPSTPLTLAIGTTRSGTLSSSDPISAKKKYYDEYRVSLSAGRTYTFDMRGNFDTYLRLYYGTNQVAYNDDASSTKHSRIEYKAKSSGTYRLIATSFGEKATGSYQVTASRKTSTPTKPKPKPKPNTVASVYSINVGSSRKGYLSTSDALSGKKKYYDIYTANLIGGRKYVVDLVSQDIDPYLIVYRGTSTKIGHNDDHNGSRTHSRVTFTAPGSGQYRFIVTSFAERDTGAYAIALGQLKTTVVRPKPKPRPNPVTGRIQRRGVLARGDYTNKGKYYDVHTFTFQAGRTYTIELTSSAFDAYLVLQSSTRQTLASNDDAFGLHSRIVYRPKRTGTYRVIATSLRTGRTGAYNVFVRSSTAPQR